MSTYTATVLWTRQADEIFRDNKYSRTHVWSFDGGISVLASAAPGHVPPATAKPDAVDPEEAFVASLSSCHMLFFLYYAAQWGAVIDRYEDVATGTLAKNEAGRFWISSVILAPQITWGEGKVPTEAELETLHHKAHADCYIANSVRTEVTVRTS
jgi:organic hydroperoxide reductase OsmC/OhrA